MDKIVKSKAEDYIEKYRNQVEGLIKTNGKFATKGMDYLACSIPNAEKLIDSYKYTQKEKVGEETYKNPD